jgi:hypothetical protein
MAAAIWASINIYHIQGVVFNFFHILNSVFFPSSKLSSFDEKKFKFLIFKYSSFYSKIFAKNL